MSQTDVEILDTAIAFGQEARRFLAAPRVFISEFDPTATGQGKKSLTYAVFAFVLTSAFVLVELRILPETVVGSSFRAIKKDELILTYWVLILMFVTFIHVGCRVLSRRGTVSPTLRTTLIAILRIYSFLVPGTTLIMILSSQLVASAVSAVWIVIPPLGVLGLEPFPPTTGNLLLVAGFMTAYVYLALFFLLCTVWMTRKTHQLSYARSCVAVVASVAALFWVQPSVVLALRYTYAIFEPLLAPFLGVL